MVRIAILLMLLGCSTDNNNLQSPPDIKKSLIELNEIQVHPLDQIKKERIIKTLQDCDIYGNIAYDKYNQCIKESKTLLNRISALEHELQSIEKEIQPWRWIKKVFWIGVFILIAIFIVKVYLKYKPI